MGDLEMTRILFVDDDEMALQLLSKAAALLGYQALISQSPRAGIELAKKENPSLILVDMRMDEMDGIEFIRQVRHMPVIADLPVVMFSAGIGPTDEEDALKAGANAFLQKPVGIGQLSQTIRVYATA
jgi:CheY-like chemotaxis protein